MPIYAYRCEACGHAKDVLRRVSDAPLTTCPACGAEAFQKQVTAAGFQLKGSGWYVTDFKGNGQNKPASDTKGESTKADSTSGEKTDAKAVGAGAGASSEAVPSAPAPKADKSTDKAPPKPTASPPPSPSSGSTPA